MSSNGGETWANTTATGATTATISGFEVTAARDGNLYRCVVTDGSGNVRISEAAEIVKIPVSITKQPVHVYGETGDAVSFSVTAKGTGLTYQWQISTNGDSSWSFGWRDNGSCIIV